MIYNNIDHIMDIVNINETTHLYDVETAKSYFHPLSHLARNYPDFPEVITEVAYTDPRLDPDKNLDAWWNSDFIQGTDLLSWKKIWKKTKRPRGEAPVTGPRYIIAMKDQDGGIGKFYYNSVDQLSNDVKTNRDLHYVLNQVDKGRLYRMDYDEYHNLDFDEHYTKLPTKMERKLNEKYGGL
jgi:hypothetical protein